MTPVELWYRRKPSIFNLKVFGSIAYDHVLKKLRKKLDKKSTKNYVVGYSHTEYRLWDPVKQNVFVSRDEIFDEGEISNKSGNRK